MLETCEKKTNSLRSDSVFFSYNAKFYTQVLLQILSDDPEPEFLRDRYIINMDYRHPLHLVLHIVNIDHSMAGRKGVRTVHVLTHAPLHATMETDVRKKWLSVYRYI